MFKALNAWLQTYHTVSTAEEMCIAPAPPMYAKVPSENNCYIEISFIIKHNKFLKIVIGNTSMLFAYCYNKTINMFTNRHCQVNGA